MSTETKVQPTAGPWEATGFGYVLAENGAMTVCEVRGWGRLTGTGGGKALSEEEAVAIMDANASLIAAAPELLEAARTLLDEYVSEDFTGEDGKELPLEDLCVEPSYFAAYHALRAAIAKAEGR